MDKTTYYVSVGSGQILQDESAAAFEFEIQATDDELNKLQELFEETAEAEISTARRGVTPYLEYSFDKENDLYDYNLREIYRMLHDLGTPETREHIESMHVLN
ncbi:hypothetical protein [Paenibacillus sp. MBLB4367]|uniref:hypothetical protein n=1 Tax=Paenibacillus sp. MBLB4367 TaxID=3384767 RepID=UPI0039083CD4